MLSFIAFQKIQYAILLLFLIAVSGVAVGDIAGSDMSDMSDMRGMQKAPLTSSNKKSEWEFGVGLGAIYFPHYLGSDQTETKILPVPYPIYRSDRFNIDREGISASLLDESRYKLDVSFGGSLPVSDENQARLGMPELDLLLEAGPVLEIRLAATEQSIFRFDIPVRAAISVDGFDWRYQGIVSNPRLHWQYEKNGWQWSSNIGLMLGNTDYHRYFYQVDPQFSQLDRPEYEAASGITAVRLSLAVTKRWDDWLLGGFVRQMNLSGSANEDSPLVKQSSYSSTGIVLVKMLASGSL